MFAHKEADRVPIIDYPWQATIERWQREGMPETVSYVDYFDLDKLAGIGVDISPRYEAKTLSETDEYIVYTSNWGVTMRQWKHAASTPEFLGFTVVDPDSWRLAKARIQPTRDRIDWKRLAAQYKTWRNEGHWIEASLTFGFDVTHAWMVGTERVLMALIDEPEWLADMFNHQLETNLALLDMVWEAGYHFDAITWCDDMGYKQNQFFSLRMYRELEKPFHKRAIEWAHAKGIVAELHSCGDIHPFVPELVEIGLDGLNPLEVKAGMDPIALKQQYGKDLLLRGGINAVLWDQPEAIKAEMESVVPVLKQGGGYVFSSDHSVPSSVSLQDFAQIIALAKQLGSYR
jgi:uroporphyrinogen decarboxylase